MKWIATCSKRIRILGGILLLFACVSGAYFLSWESRSALLSCGGCGNIRAITVRTRWWHIESVGIADGNEFAIPPNHVHRWWQYDSRQRNPYQTTGWSRQKYQDGQMEWSGESNRDDPNAKSQKPTEDWLNIVK